PAIPVLETVRSDVKAIHDSLEEPIGQAIEAVKDVSDIIPGIAPSVSRAIAKKSTQGPIQDVMVSVEDSLPVEDDEYSRLCEEAGSLPITLAEESIKAATGEAGSKVMSPITAPLKEAMNALASTFSDYFCGSGSKPSYQVKEI